MKNPLIDFVAEFATRFFSAKPKFFAIIQWISIVVGGISVLITYWESLGNALPDWVQTLGDINVTVAAITAAIMSQLPNKSPNQK